VLVSLYRAWDHLLWPRQRGIADKPRSNSSMPRLEWGSLCKRASFTEDTHDRAVFEKIFATKYKVYWSLFVLSSPWNCLSEILLTLEAATPSPTAPKRWPRLVNGVAPLVVGTPLQSTNHGVSPILAEIDTWT
jgi:hypothetical protein